MRVEEEHFDVLQNIEAAVVTVYDREPDLHDLDVLDALEALIRSYTLEERGRPGASPSLSEQSQHVADQARRVCEWRLGRSPLNAGDPWSDEDKRASISVPELIACLKRLRKSVRFWNEQGGRQGYLNYVREFLARAERDLDGR
jgi:hypothetical protein